MMYGISALMEYNRTAAQDPQYTATMGNRPARKHRVFEIGNGVFFEFWGAHEWEFTILPDAFDRRDAYRLIHCCDNPVRFVIHLPLMKKSSLVPHNTIMIRSCAEESPRTLKMMSASRCGIM